VLKPTLKDENTKTIKTMIDPFAGSGGFTLGYIDYLNKKYNTTSSDNHIDWKSQLHNIHHYDANPDVIKYVKLEFYCTTGDFNSSSNVAVHNAFTYHYNKLKFDYIVTNPPYGGDKIDETDTIKLSKELKTCIEKYFKTKYKLRTVSKAVILKLSLEDTKDINKRNQYIDIIDKLNKYTADYKTKTVTLANTNNERFLNYASEYGIDKTKCNDKESVSFLMMMEMLNEGGTAVGVLKEGLFFDSKYQHLRKHLVEKFNVSRIISIDASQFENTTTKTSIIMFHNTGKTETIRFSELQVNKDDKTEFIEGTDGRFEIKSVLNRITSVEDKFICCADYSDIVAADYTFNHKKYNKVELVPGDGFKLVKLGDVCEIKNGYSFKSSDFTTSGCKVVKIKDIDNLNINLNNISTYVKYDNKYNNVLLNNNDIILSLTGKNESICTLGVINIKDNETIYLNQRLCYLRNYKYNINYMITILKSVSIPYLNKNTVNGSIQGNIKLNDIQSLELPIPETEDQINYWVNYISEPYNKLQDYKSKLQTLEDKVKLDIQTILDNEETEEVALGELCESIKSGKNKTPDNKMGSLYPYYGTSNITGYTDYYLYDNTNILVARNGTMGNCFLTNGKIYPSDHIFVIQSIFNKNHMLYYLIKLNSTKIDKYSNGSTIKGISKETLKQIKIQLPKDRTILDSLNPTFDEIDSINSDLPKQEELYNSRLEELRKAAIKT
jgi:type I restriction-modification system DNA methylase subunit